MFGIDFAHTPPVTPLIDGNHCHEVTLALLTTLSPTEFPLASTRSATTITAPQPINP